MTIGVRKRFACKYPQAQKLFLDLPSTHSMKGMQGLLIAGIKFHELGMVKIEAEYPVRSFDSLLARLEG